MKRVFLIVSILAIGWIAKAEVEFTYEAGADIVSAYLWRGQYNGGLSFQPSASVGFDSEHVQFSVGVWGTVGASDWRFRNFIPELDIMGSLRSHGVTVGFTHYYYCDGTSFFNAGDINKIEGTSQTEVSLGIDGDDWLPEEHHAYVNWYTMVSGADANLNENVNENVNVNVNLFKRAYSSYLELGYDYTFTNIGLTLGAQLGVVPWRSESVYGTEGAALQCVALKINKAWDLGACELDLYAQGMLNANDINQDNVYIKASSDDKLYNQKLNGLIGIGIWF